MIRIEEEDEPLYDEPDAELESLPESCSNVYSNVLLVSRNEPSFISELKQPKQPQEEKNINEVDHLNKSLTVYEEIEKLKTYEGYLKFNAMFGFIGIIAVGVLSGDRFVASILFTKYEFGAIASLYSLNSIIFGISAGFSSIICSDLSRIIGTKDIPQAKRYIKYSLVVVLCISVLLFSLLFA